MGVLRWADEEFECLPQRALWWQRRRTLCIADTHLGKAATFRSVGLPIPEGATAADLQRLTALIAEKKAERLVILGDLLHAKAGRAAETMQSIADWRTRHAQLDVLLIRGNHDRHAGDPPRDWNFRIADQVHADTNDGAVAFAHEPEHVPEVEARHVLCGHIHPAATLDGPARSVRAACFWFMPTRAVLPAFGSFTGFASIRPTAADKVFIIGGDAVHDVSPKPRPAAPSVR